MAKLIHQEDLIEEKPKMVKVTGIKAPEGKPQHLEVGQAYLVTPENAELMKANKQAK